MRIVAMMALLLAGAAMAADRPDVIEVVLGSYYIKPDPIRVQVNRPVTLKLRNEAGIVPHNFVVQAPQAGIDIRSEVSAGDAASVTFTPKLTGSYRMYCDKKLPLMKSHREKGMEGWLEVVE